ncbi:lipase-like domain-containing protein [Staphylococcus aureus]
MAQHMQLNTDMSAMVRLIKMPNWEPGKKVHLVGHSMGGQTIRLMEEFLRNGNKEEIAYHKAHGENSHYSLVVITIWLHQSQRCATPHNRSRAG